jgi:hypothetical protein
VSAKIDAPPSARSSRSTDVITAYCRRIRSTASGHTRRFRRVELRWPAVRHRAIRTCARADVAEDHERRGAMVPALADVGTARIFADGVQLQVLHDPLQPEVISPTRGHGPSASRASASRGLTNSSGASTDTALIVSDSSATATIQKTVLRHNPPAWKN